MAQPTGCGLNAPAIALANSIFESVSSALDNISAIRNSLATSSSSSSIPSSSASYPAERAVAKRKRKRNDDSMLIDDSLLVQFLKRCDELQNECATFSSSSATFVATTQQLTNSVNSYCGLVSKRFRTELDADSRDESNWPKAPEDVSLAQAASEVASDQSADQAPSSEVVEVVAVTDTVASEPGSDEGAEEPVEEVIEECEAEEQVSEVAAASEVEPEPGEEAEEEAEEIASEAEADEIQSSSDEDAEMEQIEGEERGEENEVDAQEDEEMGQSDEEGVVAMDMDENQVQEEQGEEEHEEQEEGSEQGPDDVHLQAPVIELAEDQGDEVVEAEGLEDLEIEDVGLEVNEPIDVAASDEGAEEEDEGKEEVEEASEEIEEAGDAVVNVDDEENAPSDGEQPGEDALEQGDEGEGAEEAVEVEGSDPGEVDEVEEVFELDEPETQESQELDVDADEDHSEMNVSSDYEGTSAQEGAESVEENEEEEHEDEVGDSVESQEGAEESMEDGEEEEEEEEAVEGSNENEQEEAQVGEDSEQDVVAIPDPADPVNVDGEDSCDLAGQEEGEETSEMQEGDQDPDTMNEQPDETGSGEDEDEEDDLGEEAEESQQGEGDHSLPAEPNIQQGASGLHTVAARSLLPSLAIPTTSFLSTDVDGECGSPSNVKLHPRSLTFTSPIPTSPIKKSPTTKTITDYFRPSPVTTNGKPAFPGPQNDSTAGGTLNENHHPIAPPATSTPSKMSKTPKSKPTSPSQNGSDRYLVCGEMNILKKASDTSAAEIYDAGLGAETKPKPPGKRSRESGLVKMEIVEESKYRSPAQTSQPQAHPEPNGADSLDRQTMPPPPPVPPSTKKPPSSTKVRASATFIPPSPKANLKANPYASFSSSSNSLRRTAQKSPSPAPQRAASQTQRNSISYSSFERDYGDCLNLCSNEPGQMDLVHGDSETVDDDDEMKSFIVSDDDAGDADDFVDWRKELNDILNFYHLHGWANYFRSDAAQSAPYKNAQRRYTDQDSQFSGSEDETSSMGEDEGTSRMSLEDALRTLGAAKGDEKEFIQKQFKLKILQTHPDKVSHLSHEEQLACKEQAQRLLTARSVLTTHGYF